MLQGHHSSITHKRGAECLLYARCWGNSGEPSITYALAFSLVGKQALTNQGEVSGGRAVCHRDRDGMRWGRCIQAET